MVGAIARRYRGGLAWPTSPLCRAICLAVGKGLAPGCERHANFPASDAVAPDRGPGASTDQPGGLRRRMEMGRHPRAGGEAWLASETLFENWRRHLSQLS